VSPSKDIIITVPAGRCRIVQLVGALPDEVAELFYNVSQHTAEHPERFAPINVGPDGETLALTPENSPLILNLPGTYRLVCDGLSLGTILLSDAIPLGFVGQGDVR